MTLSLKKLVGSLIQERYAVLYPPRHAEADQQKAFDKLHDPTITPKMLESIYELEYKCFQMSLLKRRRGDWLHDSANVKYLKWKGELENLLKTAIQGLYETIYSWCVYEEHQYIIDEKYPGGRYSWEDDLVADMYAEHPDIPRGSDEWDEEKAKLDWQKREDFIEDVYNGTANIRGDKNPYPMVQKALDALKKPPGSIQDRIVLFHKALTTAHNNGSMLEYAIKGGNEYSNKALLDDLSAGKNLSKWNQELQQMGLIESPEGGMPLSEAMEKHPSPEEIAKTLV